MPSGESSETAMKAIPTITQPIMGKKGSQYEGMVINEEHMPSKQQIDHLNSLKLNLQHAHQATISSQENTKRSVRSNSKNKKDKAHVTQPSVKKPKVRVKRHTQ